MPLPFPTLLSSLASGLRFVLTSLSHPHLLFLGQVSKLFLSFSSQLNFQFFTPHLFNCKSLVWYSLHKALPCIHLLLLSCFANKKGWVGRIYLLNPDYFLFLSLHHILTPLAPFFFFSFHHTKN